MPKNKCFFNNEWLVKEKYKDWLIKDGFFRDKARCSICMKSFDISNMGESALTSHMKGKNHIRAMELASKSNSKLFMIDPPSRTEGPACMPNKMTDFAVKEDVLKAEIIWTLRTVEKHASFHSNEDVGDTFRIMFTDSAIAKQFSCGEKKTSYLANFGLAPYMNQCLLKQIEGNEYVVLFDESLNAVTNSKQMDIHVRLWDVNHGVITRYLSSTFMGRGAADVMLQHFLLATQDLNYKDMVQVSMDGPNVNWKFHRLLVEHLNREDNQILNIGSCGLHIVNGAFKHAIQATHWDVEKFFSNCFFLFDDSPGRAEDLLNATSYTKLPKKFCRHRWLENVPIAERALEMIPHLKKYVQKVDQKKLPHPKNKSFDTVKECLQDKLLVAKIQFFLSVARQVRTFLHVYQTDHCMVPFLAADLHSLLKGVMSRVYKHDAVNFPVEQAKKLLEEKGGEMEMTAHKVDIGFASEDEIKQLGKNLSDKEKLEFRAACKKGLLKLVSKLQEKLPLHYQIVRDLVCFDPSKMGNVQERDMNMTRLTSVLRKLRDARKITTEECDEAKVQYGEFIDDAITELREFDRTQCRVDLFMKENISSRPNARTLWKVIKILFVLSHGQASVERGFSVNKQILTDNLKEKSLISLRIISDAITQAGGACKVPITKSLIISASGARTKYKEYLEKQSLEEQKRKKTEKRKSVLDEISEMKQKRVRLLNDVEVLLKSSENFSEKAEAASGVQQMRNLLVKANSHRRTAAEKKQEATELETAISKKKDEMC